MSNKQPKQEPSKSSASKKKKKHKPNEALKYSGMVFQMATIIGMGLFIGTKLDTYYGIENRYITLVCILFFGFLAFYVVLKDLIKK
ncbi:MAG TPA: AtpZ/AtpI family protein [Saprospiraceae bacterium]|nr:AtpZ/AtpI family protein [Saprospiraceae bacterium]